MIERIAIVTVFLICLAFIFFAALWDPAYGQTSVKISLKANQWQMISLNVVPESTNIEEIFNGIPVQLMFTTNGVWWPEYQVNSINEWDFSKSYKIKVFQDCNLFVTGTPALVENIQTIPGINYISNPTQRPISVQQLLAGHENDIYFLVDGTTLQIYMPELEINTINDLLPTHGYMLFCKNSFTITF